MIRIYLPTLLLLLLLNFKAQNIYWNENYRLTYDDFAGAVPGFKKKMITFKTMAITNASIDFKFDRKDDKLNLNLTSYFIKNGSWMRPEGKNDYVLRHEQGHFDITEIYARKLRKRLDGMSVNRMLANRKLNRIVKRYVRRLKRAQRSYDLKTSYAVREKNQTEQVERIARKLKELDAYKNTMVTIKLTAIFKFIKVNYKQS
jgi:hypothetical protein